MYYVFVPNGRAPTFIHDNYADADTEAVRLIEEEGCHEAMVCQIISVACSKTENLSVKRWLDRKNGVVDAMVPIDDVMALIEQVKGTKKKPGRKKKAETNEALDKIIAEKFHGVFGEDDDTDIDTDMPF